MLKFDFTAEKLVEWPVKIREPLDGGGVTEHRFKATFKILDADEQAEVLRDGGSDSDRALLRAVVKDWNDEVRPKGGEPVPFSLDVLEQLIRYQFARQGFIEAYFQAAGGAKAKN